MQSLFEHILNYLGANQNQLGKKVAVAFTRQSRTIFSKLETIIGDSNTSFVISISFLKFQAISLLLSIFAILLPSAATAAEKITFNLNPFGQFQISVRDLEAFVATGARTPELDYYLQRLPPKQQAELPKLLSTPLDLNPLAIAKFSNSTVGSEMIRNFGKIIRTRTNRNGFHALRGAIIAAAFDEQGLTAIDLLRHYPLKTVHLNLKVFERYLQRATAIAQNRTTIDRIWFSDEKNSGSGKSLNPQFELEIRGKYDWQKKTLSYQNPNRSKEGLFDLYQPRNDLASNSPLPLIAISHGVASNRQTFAYLGKHLASHGFAVAVIEHDEISLDWFADVLTGRKPFPEANNLIEQPLDISYVIDRLKSEPRINTQRVGLVGQSFGGYSVLALAGGILTKTTTEACGEEDFEVVLDLSTLAQCTFNRLNRSSAQLKDPRIKAVIAINPMARIFGAAGMNAIEIPTAIVSGTNDLIMPTAAEQIEPFSWLDRNPDKYLVLIKPGTHFSFLQEGLGILPVPDTVVGPRPIYAHSILKAFSTAFFTSYLTRDKQYQNYIQKDTGSLDNRAFELSVIRAIGKDELNRLKR